MIFEGLDDKQKPYILKYGSGATFTKIDYFSRKAVFIYIDFVCWPEKSTKLV